MEAVLAHRNLIAVNILVCITLFTHSDLDYIRKAFFMLSNLGLFATERCPDTKCARPRCFFSHDLVISGPSQSQVPTGIREPAAREPPTAVKRKIGESSGAPVAREMKKQNVTNVTKPVAPLPTIPVRSAPAPTKTVVSGGSNSSSIDYSRPPMLPYGIKISPQPRTDRQKACSYEPS